MAASRSGPKRGGQLGGSEDRFWYMRIWNGMNLTGWSRLLVRNLFAIAPRRLGMALIITAVCPLHFVLWLWQTALYGRRIARAEIRDHPIFIIGHWRTGTTLLHEMLALDPRHTCADTFTCLAPNHFLVSASFLRPWLKYLLPPQRPMDNVAVGFDRPQEDEFALCNMGIPSPYLTIAFGNRPPQDQEYLELRGLSPRALDRWKRGFVWFLKCVTVQDPRRIVLKSPPHTARIRVLLDLFPDARFVHIVRDPYVVFPSTMNLFRRLYRDYGLQVPRYAGLDEHVFRTFSRMYEAFERDRALIRPSRLCQVRYEDVVKDPVAQMRRIYEHLELGGFDDVLPAIARYAERQKGYRTNRYEISEETRAEIARRWGFYAERYGYSLQPAEVC